MNLSSDQLDQLASRLTKLPTGLISAVLPESRPLLLMQAIPTKENFNTEAYEEN